MCITDECDEGRRAFIATAATAMAGLAAGKLSGQNSPYPHKEKVITRVLDDPSVLHGPVMFQHARKDFIGGYLARPKAEGKYAAVMVIAGNVITEEYIPNTCAALAVAGFIGLAPNIFHPPLGTDQTVAAARDDRAGHSDSDALLDINAGIDYLRRQTFIKPGAIGVVGFCYGGRLALLLGSRSREVDAVVAYHPGPFSEDEMQRLKGPVLIHQGTNDHALPKGQTTALVKNLKAQKIPTKVFWYEGADHGFLAYTRPFYKPEYAKLSWDRTIAFLKRNLAV